jgi:hypothetical protein
MKVNDGGGVTHEEENIDVMEMSYDGHMLWLHLAKLKTKTIILLQHAKINNLV